MGLFTGVFLQVGLGLYYNSPMIVTNNPVGGIPLLEHLVCEVKRIQALGGRILDGVVRST